MAVVIDSTVTFTNGTNAVTHNITFNNVTGTLLVVGFTCLRNVSGDSVSSVTYNGVSLTKIAHQNGSANNRTTNQWYLLNPATGVNTLAITLLGSERVSGAVQSYTGNDIISPIDTHASGNASGVTLSFPITTGVDNAFLFASSQINRFISSYAANTTSVYYLGGNTSVVRSINAIATAGATSLGFNMSTSEPGAPYIITSIKPVGAAPTAANSAWFNFL